MALAINIRADNASASEVERLWDQVAAFEDEPSMRTLGYRPHFTFAIYDSPEIEKKTAWEAMLRAVEGETQLRIEFRRIRWFVGPPLVLWGLMRPSPDGTLRSALLSIRPIVGLIIGPEPGRLIALLARASLMQRSMTLLLLRGLSTEASQCCST
jgi:hypothetical protein